MTTSSVVPDVKFVCIFVEQSLVCHYIREHADVMKGKPGLTYEEK